MMTLDEALAFATAMCHFGDVQQIQSQALEACGILAKEVERQHRQLVLADDQFDTIAKAVGGDACNCRGEPKTLAGFVQETIERLLRERRHFARVAWWFCENEPGTPVPDWCFLGWCNGEPVVDDEELEASEQAAVTAWG